MKTLFKLFVWLTGLVILLAIIVVITIPLFFDPNALKDDIAHWVRAKTGRELVIGGDIELSYYPWFGLRLGPLTLSNLPEHAQPVFVTIERAEIHASVPALLRRRLRFNTIVLQGVNANLSRDSRGTGNWQDLLEADDAAAAAAAGADGRLSSAETVTTADQTRERLSSGAFSDVAIDAIELRETRINLQDHGTGQHITLHRLSLHSDAIKSDQPADIAARFQLQTNAPALSVDVTLHGRVTFDRALQKLHVGDLDLQIADLQSATPSLSGDWSLRGSLDYDLDDLTVALHDMELNGILNGTLAGVVDVKAGIAANLMFQQYRIRDLFIRTDLTGGELPAGALQLTLSANAGADMIKQALTISDLSLDSTDIKLNGVINAVGLLGQPRFSGSLEISPFNPRELLQRLGQTLPPPTHPAALSRASLAAKFAVDADTLSLDPLIFRLDDSTLQGRFGIAEFRQPVLRYELSLDRLDAGRYLPAPAQTTAPAMETPGADASALGPAGDGSTSGAESLLAALRTLDIDGTLRIGEFMLDRLQLSRVVLPLRAEDGIFTLNPTSAELYGGHYRGNVRIDVNAGEPALAVDETLTNIQAGPLLQALTGEEKIVGIASANAQLTMFAASADIVRRSLNGIARFEFKDGAYKGVNIAHLLRQAQATLTGAALSPGEGVPQTDFSELGFTLKFHEGVVSNEDMSAKSPLLRVRGQGNANLLSGQLDYAIATTVVATTEGQGGADLDDLQGVMIPIRISGTFSEPQYGLDMAALVKSYGRKLLAGENDKRVQQAQQKIGQELGDKAAKELSEQNGKEVSDTFGEEAGKLLKSLFAN